MLPFGHWQKKDKEEKVQTAIPFPGDRVKRKWFQSKLMWHLACRVRGCQSGTSGWWNAQLKESMRQTVCHKCNNSSFILAGARETASDTKWKQGWEWVADVYSLIQATVAWFSVKKLKSTSNWPETYINKLFFSSPRHLRGQAGRSAKPVNIL